MRRIWTTILEPMGKVQSTETGIKLLRRKVHQTVRSVTRDFEKFEFNTIISGLMELLNEMQRLKGETCGSPAWTEAVEVYLKLLAPVAPHITEELWQRTGHPYSIHTQAWPKVDEVAAAQDEITLVVQVNGKVRDRITVAADITEDDAKHKALTSVVIEKVLEGKTPRQVIYVKGRLINIVV